MLIGIEISILTTGPAESPTPVGGVFDGTFDGTFN